MVVTVSNTTCTHICENTGGINLAINIRRGSGVSIPYSSHVETLPQFKVTDSRDESIMLFISPNMLSGISEEVHQLC